jgi:hypothetical protein
MLYWIFKFNLMSKLSWNHQRFNGILNLNFENNSAELSMKGVWSIIGAFDVIIRICGPHTRWTFWFTSHIVLNQIIRKPDAALTIWCLRTWSIVVYGRQQYAKLQSGEITRSTCIKSMGFKTFIIPSVLIK